MNNIEIKKLKELITQNVADGPKQDIIALLDDTANYTVIDFNVSLEQARFIYESALDTAKLQEIELNGLNGIVARLRSTKFDEVKTINISHRHWDTIQAVSFTILTDTVISSIIGILKSGPQTLSFPWGKNNV